MAQPVFDGHQHPLGEYLRDAGETQFFLPGVTPDLERDLEGYYRARYNLDDDDDDDDGDDENPECVRQQHPPPTVNPSIERFKYTVISSSLLSSSLSTHHHTSNRTSKSFDIPGRLQHTRDTTVEQDSSSLPVQPAFPPLGSKSATTGAATTTSTPYGHGHGQGQEVQDQDVPSSTNPRSSQAQATPSGPETTYGLAATLGSISVLFVGCGYPSLAVLFCIITVYLVYWSPLLGDGKIEIVGRHDMELTINALEELISANQSWESTVQDTVSFLEDEERTLHPLSTPLSPSPSSPSTTSPSSIPIRIRIALHTCLQTTQSQCDNIRRLFSALTSPTEISQLAEMYAPPSPVRMTFGGGGDAIAGGVGGRPWSYPHPLTISVSGRRHRPASPSISPSLSGFMSAEVDLNSMKTPDDKDKERNKRSTWSGAQQGWYASLADAGSPTSVSNRRREKYRERDRVRLGDVFSHEDDAAGMEVEVEKNNEDGEETKGDEVMTGQFGSAALDLRRRRRSGGMEAFLLRSPPRPSSSNNDFNGVLLSPPLSSTWKRNRYSYSTSTRSANRHSLLSPLPTISSSSRYTRPQPPRHPLSFASLTYALQGAIGAKRYACAHLLALRFSEEEGCCNRTERTITGTGEGDGGYWEDVRSVIGLLTCALVDSAGRLGEALEEAEGVKMREGEITPEKERGGIRDLFGVQELGGATTTSSSSFAPIPSRISRFAAHVAAISSALDDAREHLEKCVDTLKTPSFVEGSAMPRKRLHARSLSRAFGTGVDGEQETVEVIALEAYERLRRELGVALRECERGRERLLEVVSPPLPASSSDEGEDGETGEHPDDLPSLASDESDKPDPVSPRSEVEDTPSAAEVNVNVDVDDVTAHLLWTSTAQHLPMPGIEEVFEAEDVGPGAKAVAVGPFLRERSKMTREERIKIAKTRRESGFGLGLGLGVAVEEEDKKVKIERWGPGGDVVQELKDVIWKVGERKRKLGEQAKANGETTESPPPLAPPITQ